MTWSLPPGFSSRTARIPYCSIAAKLTYSAVPLSYASAQVPFLYSISLTARFLLLQKRSSIVPFPYRAVPHPYSYISDYRIVPLPCRSSTVRFTNNIGILPRLSSTVQFFTVRFPPCNALAVPVLLIYRTSPTTPFYHRTIPLPHRSHTAQIRFSTVFL